MLAESIETRKAEEENISDEIRHIEYGLGKGAIIPKVFRQTVDQWRNLK